jgi:putative membrane protein
MNLRTAADILVGVVALEHLWFLVLEMFLWQKPIGLKTFRQSAEQARASATLAANQGLYNGFLAAGLIWSFFAPTPFSTAIKAFFLACIVVAGAFGAFTVSRRILAVQALPAGVALALLIGAGSP